ncbi:EpsG family protein [Erythrobacter sp. LQ02-29]|uniref:EpsG family protein n=1 Tax=Erythrobacter sp. LQ02-29 TaxID=2920384 RepID=UPI001F4E6F56|nr:EpsG family protein [Erythrobacter sp. LQ02-29]
MVYLLTYIALIILSVTRFKRAYWFAIFGLFVFVAFRFEVGCDWSGYYNQYRVFGSYPFERLISDSEPVWVNILAFQYSLGIPYPWINVLCSIVFFVGVHMVARRQRNPLAYLTLLFPVLIMNMPITAIRQGLAIGLICGAFLAFVDRRLIRYVFLVLLAAGFHSSALIFLLLAPLIYGDVTKARLAIAGILAVPGVIVLLSTQAAETATVRYVVGDSEAAGAIFRILLLVLTGGGFLLFLRKQWKLMDPDLYRLVLIGSLMMVALPVTLLASSVIGDRLGYYLVPIQAIIFARLPYLHIPHLRRAVIVAPYIALLLMLGVWTTFSSHFRDCYLPYQTWIGGFPPATQFAY